MMSTTASSLFIVHAIFVLVNGAYTGGHCHDGIRCLIFRVCRKENERESVGQSKKCIQNRNHIYIENKEQYGNVHIPSR